MNTPDKMVTPVKATPKNARILFILDRSGSMRSIADETIGGFNAFVEGQKDLPGKATLSLVQFDNEILTMHDNVAINEVPLMDSSTFVPRGMTSLFDAVGSSIARFKNDNPEDTKTIVAILTDGEENSSKEYNYTSVNALIKEVQDENGWEVIFIGANMNATAVATSMGIKASNSVTFDYSKAGTTDIMSSVTLATRSMRGSAFAYADGTISNVAGVDMSKLYNDVKTKAIDPFAK